jgi:hypothetical protein
MLNLEIPIIGMTCGGCVNSVRNAYDPALTNPEALRGAITRAVYALAA